MKKTNDNISAPESREPGIAMGHISIDLKDFNAEPNTDDLLILPTRNLVLFPGVHLSIGLGREMSIRVAEFSESHNHPIGIVCQLDPDVDNPSLKQLFGYGVVADVLKVIELPDGNKTAIVRARDKFRVLGNGGRQILPEALSAKVKIVREATPRASDVEFRATLDSVCSLAKTVSEKMVETPSPLIFDGNSSPADIINTAATNAPMPPEVKFELLRCRSLRERAMMLLSRLMERDRLLDVRHEVMERARKGMEMNQRSAFLQQQMEAIREELYGSDSDDADEFSAKASAIKFPGQVANTVGKEIEKLRRLNPQSPDYAVQYNYLDVLLSLPWDKSSELNTDFEVAESCLEKDHYGLEKVKERIIEQLGLLIDNPGAKAPIICLVGPPGVGKTSLGESIAAALGRNYQRVALGGLHDEAEIRGHRRTYIGAMPGRIIEAMRRAKTDNPVLLLDEIDKIGADFKGDPASALLEVLDPEQNCHFHDNFVDIDFDLSKVLFIATANTLQTISRPLLDRIEVIEIPGYVSQEKMEIARRHLMPRLLKAQGWAEDSIVISDEALDGIIDNYTAESGVRQLEKCLAKILRKAVVAKLRNKEFPSPVTAGHLKELLGTPPYHREQARKSGVPGVVTGLAWTQVGGDTLLVEVSLSPAKAEGKLTLTGNLGDVMKESATIALQWVKAHADEIGIDRAAITGNDIHVHFPEGAIPKDGPSAGITMVTALVSALKGVEVDAHLAMTGEMSLRGTVIPVGGIREKLLAAKRAGVTRIILSEENRRDVEDIPESYLAGVEICYINNIKEVIDIAVG